MRAMIRALALLLPALIPSWRFFKTVAPSPRVEFALLGDADAIPQDWQEFRPRPAHLPLHAMLGRLLWNPRWNEHLFVVTCTERLLESGSERRLGEILSRIRADIRRSGRAPVGARHLRMRIVKLRREGESVVREEVYRSHVQSLDAA